MALLEYLKNCTDVQRLREGAVVLRRADRAQARQLEQGLEDLRDLDLADVAAVAGVQPGGEVQVVVVGPAGPELLRPLQDARVEHGRPGQREDGRALGDQGRVRLARREKVVLLGHPHDHRVDGAEAERLEHEARQRIVIVGLGSGSGLGQRVGHREQHQQRLDRSLRGGLDHADDQTGERAVDQFAVEPARGLQAQQPAHNVVLAVPAAGESFRQQRIEPRVHLRARGHRRGADIGQVPQVDEELAEAGTRPSHHLRVVWCGEAKVFGRQPYRDLAGERLDDLNRPGPLEQRIDDPGGATRDDILHARQVLAPHGEAHNRYVVIIAWRNVLAQDERTDDAHHPRQVWDHGEDRLTAQDLLHVPEPRDERGRRVLEDRPVVAQLLEEGQRVAADLIHDVLELLAGDRVRIAALGRDRIERGQERPCHTAGGSGSRRSIRCRHGATSLVPVMSIQHRTGHVRGPLAVDTMSEFVSI